jgi:hypothetical protein
MLSSSIARLMSVITVGMVLTFVRMIVIWVDRRTEAPVMKERINAGSDRFFVDEEKRLGDTEIDSILRYDFDDV